MREPAELLREAEPKRAEAAQRSNRTPKRELTPPAPAARDQGNLQQLLQLLECTCEHEGLAREGRRRRRALVLRVHVAPPGRVTRVVGPRIRELRPREELEEEGKLDPRNLTALGRQARRRPAQFLKKREEPEEEARAVREARKGGRRGLALKGEPEVTRVRRTLGPLERH